jgi:uncharacterized membrane protein (GlpM family)
VASFWVSLGIYPIAITFASIAALVLGANNTTGVTLASIFPGVWFAIPVAFAVIGLILSVYAIYQISQNKESKNGLALAIVGAFLSLLMIAIVIAFYFTVI